jgi:O-antigen/teichoic acid export membrane protein
LLIYDRTKKKILSFAALNLIQSDFLKNAGKLFSGSVVAQLIGLAALAALGRLYEPEDFGTVETFMKLAGVFAVVAGLRYETAIVVENHSDTAKDLVRLSLFLNTFISILLFLIILIFNAWIAPIFNFENSSILYALPFTIWIMSSTETLMMWRNRSKEYNRISSNRVLYSLSGTGYKLLNLLALSMPVFMLTIFAGQESTGHFANAYKLSYLPMSMLAMALGQVFFERIARLKKEKETASQMAHELVNIMFVAAVIPVCVLAVWGDKIAPFILGEKWEEAGVYIQITILFYFAMFMTSTFSSAFATYDKLKVQLGYNAFFLVATTTALYLGFTLGGSARVALAWFTLVGAVLRIGILNYFFLLFGKNLIPKTIFAIAITAILIYIGVGIREGF